MSKWNFRNLLTASILCFATILRAAEHKPVKVFLLAGQSNMAGLGQVADLKPPFSEPFYHTKIWSVGTLKWLPLSPRMFPAQKMFGPEIYFGHAIAGILPGREVRLIKFAKGGSSLYEDGSPETKGPEWLKFLAIADSALTSLDKEGVKHEVAGMLWLQGESDAHEGKGAEYEANLRNFIIRAREHFKTPDMPFIIARVRDFYGRENGHAKLVREAQVKVATTTPHADWFDTDDCAMFNPGHYNTDGQAVIGRRFAEAFAKITAKPGQ